jgi:hypothetical protein
MDMNARVRITIAIIFGIGAGTGAMVFGLLEGAHYKASSESVAFTACGAAILAPSVSALVAHLSGGFRDLDRQDHEE